MAAGLQGDIEGGSFSILCERGDGIALRVKISASGMVSFSYDAAVFDDHRSHHRVGVGPSPALFCQKNGPLHIISVCHVISSLL